MTSQEYLEQEQESQFPEAKRREIVAWAKKKNYSIATCQNCADPYAEKDSRKELKLCAKCEGGRAAITMYMKNHKLHTLTSNDIIKIAQSRTTRFARNTPK